ncbi:MAG: 5-formyltetrahydrofolate cyclo-ligase [Caulobacterales bacterium]|nr:5-formyltetrahydrofolate cyclo-ligase [Caulobacterales bacterium]
MTSKDEMRAAARALRKRLAQATPDAAERLAGYAEALPGRGLIALYNAIGAELDTGPLAQRLVFEGRDLCLPVVSERDAPLSFRAWRPGEALAPDAAGILAPAPSAPLVIPEVILTPLLAFDAESGRLGQGGGYYDRTFAAYPEAVRIGVAYAGQRVDRVPMEPHDMPLHGVLTETGYIPARKG